MGERRGVKSTQTAQLSCRPYSFLITFLPWGSLNRSQKRTCTHTYLCIYIYIHIHILIVLYTYFATIDTCLDYIHTTSLACPCSLAHIEQCPSRQALEIWTSSGCHPVATSQSRPLESYSMLHAKLTKPSTYNYIYIYSQCIEKKAPRYMP